MEESSLILAEAVIRLGIYDKKIGSGRRNMSMMVITDSYELGPEHMSSSTHTSPV
jgi:hypothetical protein